MISPSNRLLAGWVAAMAATLLLFAQGQVVEAFIVFLLGLVLRDRWRRHRAPKPKLWPKESIELHRGPADGKQMEVVAYAPLIRVPIASELKAVWAGEDDEMPPAIESPTFAELDYIRTKTFTRAGRRIYRLRGSRT